LRVFLKKNEPLVSVVMAAYNASRTIATSVKSLQAQSYQNWEILVADDKSTDDTASLVAGLAVSDSRIRLITLPENSGGPAIPRNVAIQQAQGDLIAFLDADDEWLPEKLQKQVFFMTSVGAALSCTGYGVIDFNNEDRGSLTPPRLRSYSDLLSINTIGCLTAMYDARILGKRYFPICGHEDYALWLSILREGYKVHGLQECLARYRLTPGSVSSSKLKVMRFFWKIYKNQEGYSYLTSTLFCLRYAWNVRGKYNN
jgi:teichuronic acid biosynthesis glycosyltransferase TuaG